MNRKLLLLAAVAVAAVLAGVLVAPKLLPKDTVELTQEAPSDLEVLRGGAWRDGEPGHSASGTVRLVLVDGVPHLHLEDFEMTAGPDVYLYLTRSDAPTTTNDVERDGVRVPVRTDADGDARLNERGTFLVPLPDGIDPSEYGGVAAWCDDFNVLFASAALA